MIVVFGGWSVAPCDRFDVDVTIAGFVKYCPKIIFRKFPGIENGAARFQYVEVLYLNY